MKKVAIAFIALAFLVLLAFPAFAQEPNRLDKIETSIANLNAKLDSMSDKLDKLIAAKTLAAPAPDPFAITAKAGCACAQTGVCTCAQSQMQAAPVQYMQVCGPNGCSMVPVTSGAYSSSPVASGGCASGNCGSGGSQGIFGGRFRRR